MIGNESRWGFMINDAYVPDNGFRENFINTKGRLNRKRFFKRSLVLALLGLIIIIIVAVICDDGMGDISNGGVLLLGVLMIGVNLMYYCLAVRRLHDLGMKNTLAIVLLVSPIVQIVEISDFTTGLASLIGFCGVVYLLFAKGVEGANEYGPDPLGQTVDHVIQQEEGSSVVSNLADNIPNTNMTTNLNPNNSLNSSTGTNINNNNEMTQITEETSSSASDDVENEMEEVDDNSDDDDDDTDFDF